MSWKDFRARRVVKLQPAYVEEVSRLPPYGPEPEPPGYRKLVAKTDMAAGDGIVNEQPEEISVEDYMKLKTGVFHKVSEPASSKLGMRVAYCGHREPHDWKCSEILDVFDFQMYVDERTNVGMFCSACRDRLDLESFGETEL